MGAFLDNTGLTTLVQLIKGSLPTKATSSTLGLVKPDNSTITVDSDGVISSSGGGTTYTAGNGISIDANDVISECVEKDGWILSLIDDGNSLTPYWNPHITGSYEKLYERVKEYDQIMVSNTRANGYSHQPHQNKLYELGIRYILKLTNNGITREQVNDANLLITLGNNLDNVFRIGKFLINVGKDKSPRDFFKALVFMNYDNTNTDLEATTVSEAIDEIASRIPAAPTTDGNYVLKCSVVSGTPTYSWVSET